MSYALLPEPKIQFCDANGKPLAGGKLYTYGAGSTTAKTTYTTSSGTANANPVVLDSAGRASVWLDGFYYLELYDSTGTLIWTQDNVSSMSSSTAVTNQWYTQPYVPTYISATQFSVPGNVTTIFPAGVRITATLTGSTLYGTVVSASAAGSPLKTTVTVLWDSGSLDSTVSSFATGIITPTYGSTPIPPAVTKTSSYPFAATDVNQVFLGNSASGITFTLVAATSVPSGSWIRIRNIGTGAVTLLGTVDGQTNPVLYAKDEIKIWTDGSSWYGTIIGEPIGSIKAWLSETPPSSWLECDGRSLVRASYPALLAKISTTFGFADGSHFYIPDFRGYFLRGKASGSTLDPDKATRTDRGDGTTGDAIGTRQSHALAQHNHTERAWSGGAGSYSGVDTVANGSGSQTNLNNSTDDFSSGGETRPVNAYVLFIIKAL